MSVTRSTPSASSISAASSSCFDRIYEMSCRDVKDTPLKKGIGKTRRAAHTSA
jgi:hypothetical protein